MQTYVQFALAAAVALVLSLFVTEPKELLALLVIVAVVCGFLAMYFKSQTARAAFAAAVAVIWLEFMLNDAVRALSTPEFVTNIITEFSKILAVYIAAEGGVQLFHALKSTTTTRGDFMDPTP